MFNFEFVSVAEASDGVAACMTASSSGWNIQFNLDKLPPEHDWWLYMSLRLDLKIIERAPMLRMWGAIRIADHETGVYVQASQLPPSLAILVDRIIAGRTKIFPASPGLTQVTPSAGCRSSTIK